MVHDDLDKWNKPSVSVKRTLYKKGCKEKCDTSLTFSGSSVFTDCLIFPFFFMSCGDYATSFACHEVS